MIQHLLITGASSGIGEAIARHAADNHLNVTAIARRSDRLASLHDEYPHIHPETADITDKKQVAAAIARAIKVHGPVDCAILNAGIYQPVDATHIDSDVFDAHMSVNYSGIVYCLESVIPAMVERGSGHIAVMGSTAGYRGLPRSAAYGPTKAAVQNLAECLYFDLNPHNIKVQIINPGFIETEATAVNDFEMPDIITAEVAARDIFAQLKSDRFEIAVPRGFVAKMKLLRLLPLKTYLKLVAHKTGHLT